MLLNEVQEKFKQLMLQPASGLESIPPDLHAVFVQDHISARARLKIYHNNVIGSISASLCAGFPLLEKLVGADFLKGLARDFIFQHPPQSGCMHHYGAGFDDFIRAYGPCAALPYLGDVAAMEIAINNAYYADDDVPLGRDELAGHGVHGIGDVILSLRSSAALLSSAYPLMEIRDFCLDEVHNAAPDLGVSCRTRLLVFRPNLEVKLIVLEEDAFFMLSCIHDGIPLAQALDKTLELYPAFDFNVFLQRHIMLETFSSLRAK